MKSLDGKIALVTGGSRGIGKAICVELARRGAYVFVNYSASPEAAEETVTLCEGNAEAIGFTVSDSTAVASAFASIKEKKRMP